MSTKIFNAYLLPKGTGRTGRSLIAFSKSVRAKLLPIANAKAYAAMARHLAFTADACSVGLSQGSSSSAFTCLRESWDEARKDIEEGRRSPRWDFGLEWCFLATPSGRLVIKIFGENIMCEAFERAFPHCSDYHFQDSTDRPKEIPETEWNQRRKDWGKMAGRGSFCVNALSMKLFGPYEGPSPFCRDEILEKMPSCWVRATAVAREIALRDWLSIHPQDRENFKANEMFAFLREYESEENRSLRLDFIESVRERLSPRLTVDWLLAPTKSLVPEAYRAPSPMPSDMSLDCSAL